MRKLEKMKVLDIIDNWKLDIGYGIGFATTGLMYTLENYGVAIGVLAPTIITTFFAIRKHLLDEKLTKELHEEKLKEMRERHIHELKEEQEKLKQMRERHLQELKQDEEEFQKMGKNNT